MKAAKLGFFGGGKKPMHFKLASFWRNILVKLRKKNCANYQYVTSKTTKVEEKMSI